MKVIHNPTETRQTILEAAYEEIYVNGFQAASLENILAKTDLTKGALYHHFPNKMALGYAVVDEIIKARVEKNWVNPISQEDDPVAGLRRAFQEYPKDQIEHACQLGCPLFNLVQEMSPIDEGFREKTYALLSLWRKAIAQATKRGQKKGIIRQDVSPENVASFVVAAIEGSAGLIKNAKDAKFIRAFQEELGAYLKTLKVT